MNLIIISTKIVFDFAKKTILYINNKSRRVFAEDKVTMKIDLCVYSGYKIYPGHGRTLVKVDGKSYK